MRIDPSEILAQLVAIPSVNPMGRREMDPSFGEERLTGRLAEILHSLGLLVERQAVAPRRENLVARLDGQLPPEQGGAVVLLDAHQDTVPVDGMTIEPFEPKVDGGRLYGRGACDAKGGMAAILAAVSRLAEERPPGMPTVVISCTVNEEYGFTGAMELSTLWTDRSSTAIPRRPDAAVVAEPTGLDVVVAHKGVVRWKCHTVGRACHSAEPESGDNAIYKMGHVLAAIERYAQQRVGALACHKLCGPATLSVGTICGGVSVNTVPDRCTIEIDRRLPPGEHPDEARAALIDHLAAVLPSDLAVQHDPPYMRGLPLADDGNASVAEGLRAAVNGPCRRIGVSYATNAAFYSAAGVPSVVFGPGRVEQAHTQDEWISLDQLSQAAEIFYRFCRDFPPR